MTASLKSDIERALGRAHPKQIRVLIALLRDFTRHNTDFVAERYCEQCGNFAETLWFLKEIAWVRETGTTLELTSQAYLDPAATEIQNATAIIDAMSNCHGGLSEVLCGYLAKFSCQNSEISLQPSVQDRLDQWAIRNFLMELSVVSHDSDNDRYILDAHFVDLYLWAQNVRGASSKEKLLRLTKQRDELGIAAELAALQFEKERVGPAWAEKVEHISASWPNACYDIKSVTVSGNASSPCYIEVKAVPEETYRFFWTASELEAARLLTQRYFLYLLPVLDRQMFDLSKMIIIQNPYDTVYHSEGEWSIETEVVSCYKKPTL